MKNSRIRRRVYELLSKASMAGPLVPGQRELHFIFFRKPDRFLEEENESGHLRAVRLEKTTLKEATGEVDEAAKQVAVGLGEYEDLSCGLVLKSIGYKSLAIDGLPFDSGNGIVPNVGGRVISDNSEDGVQYEKGLYVCGWLKRGPTGIIGTNMYCAEETVGCIADDILKGTLSSSSSELRKPGREGLLRLLDNRNVRFVSFDAWERIDLEERRLGALKGKPREKLGTWEDLLKVACC